MKSYLAAVVAALLLAASSTAAEPIIVKAQYSPKRVCVPIPNGNAMMIFDEFDVKKATGTPARIVSIRVVPSTASDFLKRLKKGDAVTLSIQPSEQTLKQLKDRKKDDLGFLVIDGNELTLLPEKRP